MKKKIVCLSDLLNKSPNDGVIVECGVGVGFSLTVLALLSKKKYLLLTVLVESRPMIIPCFSS